MKIKFKRDTAFRKQFFVPDSFAHPAKMDAQLLIWIVEHYTVAGETILDPMAGSGTTMLACTLGRSCILVELEYKFCMMMWDNWYRVQMRPQLGSTMGSCKIIQGDARQLEGLVDKIVTSPPYANIGVGQEASKALIEERIKKGIAGATITEDGRYMTGDGKYLKEYSPSKENIGNLPYGEIDKIVTSPPYEASVSSGEGPGATTINRKNARASSQPNYSEAQDNIGNLKSESYLEAMLQVYQQCYKVLKPEGLMILVTKNFIRNKRVVRLDEDTIKLCEQAGFNFVERHYRELPSQSFWRVIYHQKFPDVEQIKSEDVLIFRK